METKEILRSLAKMDPEYYTKSDRDYIRELSEQMGVPFKPRKGCPNCYSDQAVLLWSKLQTQESERAYVLKPGLDFFWKGRRINNETLTDELAETILAEGLPALLFEKVK